MPTTPGTASATLDPKGALEKITGLISETTDTDETPPVVPEQDEAETPASPEPPPQSPGTESDDKYEVKVDGQTEIVDLEELKAGYSRDADYRRKTMALADERRAFETEQQGIQQERTEYRDGLTKIRQALEQLQGEPNWDELRKTVPASEFLERKADWEHQRMNLERLKLEEQRQTERADKDKQEQFQKYVRGEQDKLRAAIPEWSDPEVQKTEAQKIVQAAKQYGFTEQEVQSVVDHRAIRLLRDAMKYRELHRDPAPAVKAKVSPIKAAKPGTPVRPRPNETQAKLIEQVGRTHRSMDAMRAIESLLPD